MIKKYTSILTGVLLLVAPTAASADQSQCVSLSRNLHVGSTGGDVMLLQNFLNGQGYLSVAATGYFGSRTQTAVQRSQA